MKGNQLTIYLDDAQLELLERASAADDDKPNNWSRRMLLRIAREKLHVPPPGLETEAPEKAR